MESAENEKTPKNTIRETSSICPQCNRILDAIVFEGDGKVFITKNCPEHGNFEDVYFGSYEIYKKFEKFAHEGKGIENPNTAGELCPNSCGLCKLHKSGTALANIMLTNRCDLACWYCFAYAKKENYVYEPTIEQIREMLITLRNEKPVPPTAIQFTGGEPTLREDLIEIIHMAKDEGFKHVQLNTNGINLSRNPQLAIDIKKAGVNTIYLSFDGVSEKTNPKNHWEIPKILENCRKAGVGIVLVPTVINGVNDHELGEILRFGFRNIDVVRGINFQPVSMVGRMPKEQRERIRITIPDVIEKLEEQTGGEVAKSDFYPVPTVVPITHLVEEIKGKPQYEFSCLPFCGAATYIFKEDCNGKSKMIPITRFVNVESLLESIQKAAERIHESKIKTASKLIEISKLAAAIKTMIDEDREPEDLDLTKILVEILKEKGSYHSLGELHHRALFVGMMHFQDKYNYDIQRVQRCVIHYATPDKRIIPFCAFNVIPEIYRDAIQKKYSIPIEEWEKKTGRKIEEDFYKRDIEKLKNDPAYENTYGRLVD